MKGFLVILSLIASSFALQNEFTFDSRPLFLLFGASITERSIDSHLLGFGSLLQQTYNRKVDVIVRGEGGYTSKTGLFITPFIIEEFLQHPPSLLTIEFGTNDAISFPLSLQEYETNLKQMIHLYSSAFPKLKIILLGSPPPTNERKRQRVAPYAEKCQQVATELGIPFVNSFQDIQKYTDWENMFVDGIHFNTRGNKAMYAALQDVIDTKVPQLQVKNIPRQFPPPKLPTFKSLMHADVTFNKRPVFLLFGDSITEAATNPYLKGYGCLMAYAYSRKADVYDRGDGGYTTRDALLVAPFIIKEFLSYQPMLLTIAFGTNDALRRPLPVDEYGRNLKQLVHLYKNAFPNVKILLLTPPPPTDKGRRIKVEPFALKCIDIGKELSIPVVDSFHKIQTYSNWTKDMFIDGIHFKERGNKAMYHTIQEVIDAALPELQVKNLPRQFPDPKFSFEDVE